MATLAEEHGCAKSTISKTVKRFERLNSGKSRSRTGRPKAVKTRQTVRRVLRDVQKNPWKPYKEVAEDLGLTAASTVREIAEEKGFGRYVPAVKPFISDVNIRKRYEWALENKGRNWQNIIWTDETSIVVGEHFGRPRVTCKKGYRYDTKYMLPSYASGRRSAMFWAAISYHGKSRLIRLSWPKIVIDKNGEPKKGGFTNKEYAAQILSDALPTFLDAQMAYAGTDFLVLEDGAPVHRGPFVREARELYPFNNLSHPASSPDLNPLENVWAILKRRIWKVRGAHSSLGNLLKATQKVWDEISQEEIQTIIDSMPQRVEAVIDAQGGSTRF